MKLLYIANIRLPTEKAHAIQIMKMCEVLADKVEVSLIIPRRRSKIKIDASSYYGVRANFVIKKFFTIDTVGVVPGVGFLIQTISFALSLKLFLWPSFNALIYSREFWVSLLFKDVFLELHGLPEKILFIHRLCWRRASKIIVLTDLAKRRLMSAGVLPEKILVIPDGVDLKIFKSTGESVSDLRKKLLLPPDKKIIMYTGHLFDWKGVQTLAAAAKILPKNVVVVLVGGTELDVEKFKFKNIDTVNLMVLGYKKPLLIPEYMKAADILILPNSGKFDISRSYTSPLKLFEYMAIGRPIIASDLPAIREILDEETAFFFKADDFHDLARQIKNVLSNPADSDTVVRNSLAKVKEFSWRKRAEKVISFILS